MTNSLGRPLVHEWQESTGSIIGDLNQAQVVNIEILSGRIFIEEQCDREYDAYLTPDEFDKFILELQELRKQLP